MENKFSTPLLHLKTEPGADRKRAGTVTLIHILTVIWNVFVMVPVPFCDICNFDEDLHQSQGIQVQSQLLLILHQARLYNIIFKF